MMDERPTTDAVRVRATRLDPGAHLVTVLGELDGGSSHMLSEAFDSFPVSDTVVDLGATNALDPVALGTLRSAAQRVRAAAASLIVVCERESARAQLHAAGLDRHLLVERSLDDAHRYLIGRVLLKRLQEHARAQGSTSPRRIA